MMSVKAGTQLGTYEIVAPIGAGGMGEVYQAHDTKLGRDVAIKVLPEAFAHDSDRLARFQREARMLASLNHPNIATIHGLEQSNGTSYLVMELVSGETLAERVKRERRIPVEEALRIAVQIAEALETAHEKGIIHRDLKPANVKVTPEGKVKVLDFGLAKAFAGDTADSNPSQSPTLSAVATMQGVLLGTAAYMSPEQARGKAIDKRTDIWAFGCVLYELLTGRKAFEGEDITEILAAVVKTEPEWQALPPTTPAKIRDLLRRCFQKDKALRMRDAGDARIEIQEALTSRAEPVSVPKGWQVWSWRHATVVGLAAVALLAIGGIATWRLRPSPPLVPVSVNRSVFSLPAGQRFPNVDAQFLALSPDGKKLVYAANAGGTEQLYLRSMDSFDARPIPGTEGGLGPFFSPDSEWVGFFASGKLKKVSVAGGLPVTLCDATDSRGATWGTDDTIVFASAANTPLFAISSSGGMPRTVTKMDWQKDVDTHRWPEFLPGSSALLFTVAKYNAVSPTGRIALRVVATGEQRELIPAAMNSHYVPTGHLVYAQGGNLMTVRFDLGRLKVTYGAVPIVEGVMQSPASGTAQYSLSNTGALVYIPGGLNATRSARMVWVDRHGTERPIAAPPRAYQRPRLSPDGNHIAVAIMENGGQVWIYDLARETLSRLTFGSGVDLDPVWLPDGKRITFESGAPGNLFWQPADGSGKAERLATADIAQVPTSWAPDGQVLAFVDVNPNTGRDIWTLKLSDRSLQPFLQTSFDEGAPAFSPDGRWLAYGSDESGRREVYVQPYPGPGGKWQISTEGGSEPTWNPNGRELFYRNGDKMLALDVTTQPTFSAGKAKLLFEGQYQPSATPSTRNYDVSADGQHFLMVKADEQEQSTSRINVVLNWFEELKRRVPTGK
jgi:serine/threonine protein kinase/Tol biopolymer transport system component